MENFFTPNNIMFVLGILGVIFGVYKYFRNPQIDSDKRDALLAQQVQWQIEGNERKFQEIQTSIKDAFNLAQNHTHSVDVKVDKLAEDVKGLSTEITKLSTIISERIPKR